MTHVADKIKLAKFFRFLHGVSERAIKGSLHIEQFIGVVQVLLDKGERAERLLMFVAQGCPVVEYPAPSPVIIDLDATPRIPDGYAIARHQKNGMFVFDSSRVRLYLDRSQQTEGRVKGNVLDENLQNLQDATILNACVLDWYLANPCYIPEGWKGKTIVFWGTMYCNNMDDWFVRYLYWDDAQWCSGIKPATGYCNWFTDNSPVAVYAIQ